MNNLETIKTDQNIELNEYDEALLEFGPMAIELNKAIPERAATVAEGLKTIRDAAIRYNIDLRTLGAQLYMCEDVNNIIELEAARSKANITMLAAADNVVRSRGETIDSKNETINSKNELIDQYKKNDKLDTDLKKQYNTIGKHIRANETTLNNIDEGLNKNSETINEMHKNINKIMDDLMNNKELSFFDVMRGLKYSINIMVTDNRNMLEQFGKIRNDIADLSNNLNKLRIELDTYKNNIATSYAIKNRNNTSDKPAMGRQKKVRDDVLIKLYERTNGKTQDIVNILKEEYDIDISWVGVYNRLKRLGLKRDASNT